MKEWISKVFSEFEEERDFHGSVDESLINEIEKKLQCTFPESYRWFLKNYGGGGVLGIDLTCVGSLDNSPIILDTEAYRKMDMPREYVVIWDLGEYLYCLDTTNLENGECPVVTWDFVSKKTIFEAKNFYEFLSQQLEEAIEDYED
ncbi:SMI1/KNR4 family protein [Bacillus sp. UNC322MFChir4.1]|uniref:SMI1/KNR4 family protein n=1 Tax=Bacillus sp. UNC322MFChir4.1 TaxID=1449045 RepID=UPI000552B7C9|nr:SMI1/KNR4 family protein [Bacillus sp. UNC322MFChir4.1]